MSQINQAYYPSKTIVNLGYRYSLKILGTTLVHFIKIYFLNIFFNQGMALNHPWALATTTTTLWNVFGTILHSG